MPHTHILLADMPLKLSQWEQQQQVVLIFSPRSHKENSLFSAYWVSHFIRTDFRFVNCTKVHSFTDITRECSPSSCPPFTVPVYSQPSSPRSCSRQLTASPPCAIGASYQERPRPRGGWACSRVHCATAPRALSWGEVQWAAGWWGWGRGWSAHGDTCRCSTWIK